MNLKFQTLITAVLYYLRDVAQQENSYNFDNIDFFEKELNTIFRKLLIYIKWMGNNQEIPELMEVINQLKSIIPQCMITSEYGDDELLINACLTTILEQVDISPMFVALHTNMNAKQFLEYLRDMDETIPMESSSGSSKKRKATSTLDTFVRTATDHVDANGKTKSSQGFQDLLNHCCGPDEEQNHSNDTTGVMLSYISSTINNKMRKYGYQTPYKDYRLQLKLYDGNQCKTTQQWWKGHLKSMDITFSKNNNRLQQTIQKLFDQGATTMDKEKTSLIESTRKFSHY